MDLTFIIVLLVVLMAAVGMLVVFITVGAPVGPDKVKQQVAVSDSLRSLVTAQRQQQARDPKKGGAKNSLAVAAAAESQENIKQRSSSSRMTLEKKLKYAKWSMTAIQFRTIQTAAAIVAFIPAYVWGNTLMRALALFLAPALVMGVLDRAMKIRFKMFDDDYPVLLMQYVSLLKTGMSTIGGLEAAAKGLDEGSLVRSEVELMIERLRMGLSEDQAINAFGEDIAHPELELFVQSLLLSRRVGGTLSLTLERLAKQVRKRQQFREQAVAAVGMERGSIYAIAVIMSLLMAYITFSQPELVLPAFSHPTGNNILQTGFVLVVFGFYWSKKVTNIKV